MKPDASAPRRMTPEASRRCLLQAALAGVAGLARTSTFAGAAAPAHAAASPGPSGAHTAQPPGAEVSLHRKPDRPPQWTMMLDLTVRIPAGTLDSWNDFWGRENVPALEERGQWLWGAWSSLTGQQNTITHQWAYRDLAHFQAMTAMRASDPHIHELAAHAVPIEEIMISSVMTPLAYHPAALPEARVQEPGIIVTSRILPQRPGSVTEYVRIAADYIALAAHHGAELTGAFQTYFGWTPSYLLHVWRYPTLEHYWTAHRAIEADREGHRLLATLRGIYPHETVDLHVPTSYSRLR